MGAVSSCIPRRRHGRGSRRRSTGALSLVTSVAVVSQSQNTSGKADTAKATTAVTVTAIDSTVEAGAPIISQTKEGQSSSEPRAEATEAPTSTASGPEPTIDQACDTKPTTKTSWSQAWTWCTKPLPRSKTSKSAGKPEPYILLPRIYPAMPPTPPSHTPNHPSASIAAQLMPIDPANPYISAEMAFLLARRAELREIKRARWEAVRIEARWARVRRGEWEGGEGDGKTFVRVDASGNVKMRTLRTVEEQGVWVEGRSKGAEETKGEGEDGEKGEEVMGHPLTRV